MSISINNIDKRQQPYAIAIFSIGLIMICAGATIPFLIHLHILTLSINMTNVSIAAVLLALAASVSILYAINRPVSDISTAVDQALQRNDIPSAINHLNKSPEAPTEALIKALGKLDGNNPSTSLAKKLLNESGEKLVLSGKTALLTALQNNNTPGDIIEALLKRADIDAAPQNNEAGNSRLVMLSQKKYANRQALQTKLIQHAHFQPEATPSDLYDLPELHALAKPTSGLSSALLGEYLTRISDGALSTKYNNQYAIEYIISDPYCRSDIQLKAQITQERYICFRQHPGFTDDMDTKFKENLSRIISPGYLQAFLNTLSLYPDSNNELNQKLEKQRKKADMSATIVHSSHDGKARNGDGTGMYPPTYGGKL